MLCASGDEGVNAPPLTNVEPVDIVFGGLVRRQQALGAIREQVAHRRGNRNIGAVAAARRQLELVFYGLRDHHIRALHHPPRAA